MEKLEGFEELDELAELEEVEEVLEVVPTPHVRQRRWRVRWRTGRMARWYHDPSARHHHERTRPPCEGAMACWLQP